MVAVGVPVAHDTRIDTQACPSVKLTQAVGAGPRNALASWNPCAGLQETRYAIELRQRATAVPPSEESTRPDPSDGEVVVALSAGVGVAVGVGVVVGEGLGEAGGAAEAGGVVAASSARVI